MTGTVFAQLKDGISISTGGGGIFVPLQGKFTDKDGDDDEAKFYTGVGDPPKIDFKVEFTAADGRTGGKLSLDRNDDRHFTVGDLNVWVKPFGNELLHLQVGKGGHEFLGAPGLDTNTMKYTGDAGKGGGEIFDDGLGGDGVFIVYSKPITGLHLYGRIDPGWKSHDGNASSKEMKDVYKKIKAGVGYEIANIGTFRAQWVGNSMDGFEWDPAESKYSEAKPARIDAAFKLKAVENLEVDLGVKLPIPFENGEDTIYQDNFKVGAAADFKAGDFGIKLGVYGAFGGNVAYELGSEKDILSPRFDLAVIPSFYLAGIDATVGADIGFTAKGKEEVNNVLGRPLNGEAEETVFGFGGWVQKKIGNSAVKTGLFYKLPPNGPNGTKNQTGILTWPIILDLSF